MTREHTDLDRNRKIATQRLGWPDGALEACEENEAKFPGYYCWWTPTPWPDPGFQPAYGAALTGQLRTEENPAVYGRTPGELAERISEEIARQAERHA